ncbi:response regulator transcription factor [Lactobacillaceae bacterium L1_55_11]|nr:response regulator transcription factor [Lactobacillaceae bacterium L1_55_11]
MAYKIFIVEDNPEIVALLQKGLSSWGMAAASCHDFNQVSEEVAAYDPDLILMDVNLPFHNGFFWTQQIRSRDNTPIIFLSSRDEDSDQIMAMNFGADDYITKPFNLDLLAAKIQALLRRQHQSAGSSQRLHFAGYQLDILDNTLANDGASITLSKNETKLLHHLFSHPQQLVAREDIIADLWEDGEFIDRNTLSVTLARLRTKSAPLGFDRHLQTVKGKGLMLRD